MVEPSSFFSAPCSAGPAWQILVCWDSWEDGALPAWQNTPRIKMLVTLLIVLPASIPQWAQLHCPPQSSYLWWCCKPSPERPPRSFYSWSTTFSPLWRPNIPAWNKWKLQWKCHISIFISADLLRPHRCFQNCHPHRCVWIWTDDTERPQWELYSVALR